MDQYRAFGILVLAAGESRRMEKVKQLLPVGGEQLIARALKVAISTGVPNILVVLGAHADSIVPIVQNLPVHMHINPTWNRGMGNSLKAGMRRLLTLNPKVDGVVVMVCDQPYVTSSHIQQLLDAYIHQQTEIIASAYKETMGVPAFFSSSIFPLLMQIQDGEGAKGIIEANPEKVLAINFPPGAIDLDTPADYDRFVNDFSN